MRIENILFGFLILCIFTFIIAVGVGIARMANENRGIRDNCVKTDLVVIGNKGHAAPVYDCGKKETIDIIE